MDNTYQYVPGREMDYALLHWMERMIRDDEIDKTLTTAERIPVQFLEFFKSRPLFFQVDAFHNIKRACWFEPSMGSAFWGLWINPDVRISEPKANVAFVDAMVKGAFDAGINTLVGLIQDRPTSQETGKLIAAHQKGWGFEYRGYVPKFFQGKDCHIVALTNEDWQRWVEKAGNSKIRTRLKALPVS